MFNCKCYVSRIWLVQEQQQATPPSVTLPGSKLPQSPVTAPDWLCTYAEANPPTLCSDPAMFSRVQQQAGDLAQQVNLRIMQMTSAFYITHP